MSVARSVVTPVRVRVKMAEDLETQREEIATLLKTPLCRGETWYLVSSDWFKQWKKYVGFDRRQTGDRNISPGPVNNYSLFKVGDKLDIKEHLIDELDYIMVPTEGWNKLVRWYGLTDGQEPVARKVVLVGMFVKHHKVEVYLTKLNLCENSNMDSIVTRRFSKADTIDTIEREMRKLFSIPDEKETRLWNKYMNNRFELLNKLNSTILEAGLFDGQVLVVEQKNEDGTWSRDPSTIKPSGASTLFALPKRKMAEARFSEDEFTCSVCLDLLKDPVTIPCGHSYCKSCITGCWDQENQKRVYSCPQCRQTFKPRPALAKNTMLAEVVEKLKKRKLPADCYAGAGDVQCDVCPGQKHKAVKSCLVCLNSYCQNHLDQHESLFKEKRHNLTEATGRLQEMICQTHDKILEVFCRTDQKCICVLCMMDEHKNHDTVSAAAQRTEKQSFQSLSAPPESTDVNDDPFSSLSSFDGVRESVLQLREKLEDFCKEELKKISDRVTFTNIVPRTRNDFLQYSHQLTLDLNTVNKHLRLSERNRVITNTDTEQSYPDHPDRFDHYDQVLCRESVCDRHCYWEIECSGDDGVFISVSYKSISRKGRGNECVFGNNDQSWSLVCSSSSYSFRHNNRETKLPVKPIIRRRIGVYVDHSAGTLSFYSVSGDTMSLIHTVQTTFTQPLYPGFRVVYGSSVKLC
ncbi:Ubiquitin carboxyl-terminal hydrolase 15 [Anabarilius grahami]|uniref:ubiquitinyl hydrolase 1 n=1 Tax=Anabarilius grahami TaxID=495550 RepID=A0A3N0YGS3_ANAGA|nr:Ubiquitin carboxyl-terminal hydrolase 15 [Anabarilius grahami]